MAALLSDKVQRGDRVWQAQPHPPLAGSICACPILTRRRRFFPGHGPDRHPVEAGHRSGGPARSVRLQPPSEGARAAEAAGAGGGEAAAPPPRTAESSAGAAAAGRGDGRVRAEAAAQRSSAAVGRRAPGGCAGTRT